MRRRRSTPFSLSPPFRIRIQGRRRRAARRRERRAAFHTCLPCPWTQKVAVNNQRATTWQHLMVFDEVLRRSVILLSQGHEEHWKNAFSKLEAMKDASMLPSGLI